MMLLQERIKLNDHRRPRVQQAQAAGVNVRGRVGRQIQQAAEAEFLDAGHPLGAIETQDRTQNQKDNGHG
jgi:hypothetical protein